MNKDDAKSEALRLWRQLPASDRKTDNHAAIFALKLSEMDGFRELGRTAYQQIQGWLRTDIGKP